MKITDVIKRLEEIKSEHGDLKVYKYFGWDIMPMIDQNLPSMKELVKLNPRESKLRFKDEYGNKDREVIEKVCKI